MVREIVKDTKKLSEKCITATSEHKTEVLELILDMRDTAAYYEDKMGCVGLAANQVGSDLRVILAKVRGGWIDMVNPVITRHSKGVIESEEGCLSLEGVRTVKRWDAVEVIYRDHNNRSHKQAFTGFEACIVQHEIDHLNGKLI